MRIVLQRVLEASVRIDGETVAQIEQGLCLLVGFSKEDDAQIAQVISEKIEPAVRKICALRVFSDESGKLMHDLKSVGGSLLIVPQFTLYGSVRKGRRPDFIDALEPQKALSLYEAMVDIAHNFAPVETGVFGADMKVSLINDGPFTLNFEY